MKVYLGETEYPQSETPYAGYKANDWVLHVIECYGQIDGGHHKQWVLDQVSRAVHGGLPQYFKLARWDNGYEEWRVGSYTATDEYKQWVAEMKDGECGPDTYDYDEGIVP